MAAPTYYNLKNVTFVWGAAIATGVNEIKITWNSDVSKTIVSTDGHTKTRVGMNDRSAKIEVNMNQMSGAHSVFDIQFKIQEAGTAVSPPCSITSPKYGQLFTAESCWVEKQPDPVFGADVEDGWIWTFGVGELLPVYGSLALLDSGGA